ncbi:MAG: xanthine dehydrogenase family protein molybdopterin-binding subunit [Gammaproteobacteria bacterium]
MRSATAYIGTPISRVDGHAKVTGVAKYAAEFKAPRLAHGVIISSPIARGKIVRIDVAQAISLQGVLEIFTHENVSGLAGEDACFADALSPPGSPFRPLYSNEIQYSGQPVALVIAETFELARYAATLVHIEYEAAEHDTSLGARRGQAYVPEKYRMGEPVAARGDADAALAGAGVCIEADYSVPVEHHNAMEPFASTAIWEGDDRITVYDKTQGVLSSKQYICNVFGLKEDAVRVVSPYVGGAFGSGLRRQYQLFMAVLAARALKQPVKVVLTRQQMFTFGHRPATLQRLALGADKDGRLVALTHAAIGETSRFEEFAENVVNWSSLLYQCDNTRLEYKLVQLDLYTPIDMRAPGATLGVFALECAMDELAHAAGIDPLELRLKNYAERDQDEDKPFTSKALRECYAQGAERFGWARRNAEPRSMREGNQLVGWGMATGVWEALQNPASANARLDAHGKLQVGAATADIGTGTYTIMTQIAAETLGLAIEDVTFNLGDTSLPRAPIEGGSWTAVSVGSAVKAACEQVREKLFSLARDIEGSPLAGAHYKDITFTGGQMCLSSDASKAVSIRETIANARLDYIEEQASAESSPALDQYSAYTHSAVFAEVKIDEALSTLRVTRVVSAVAGGRILNPKTARSQILGSVVWGIGMALQEESVIDQTFGRFMNHNLAEYHVPVNADIHDIDVIFVAEQDDIINPLGAKGLGEIGIVGVAAAIANAVFHATGKRVRDLPITLDKIHVGENP